VNLLFRIAPPARRACSQVSAGPKTARQVRTTKVRSPRTNGFVERMNRTLLDECFRVQGRTKWYVGPDEIQRDLDTFMAFYNFQRTHQGYRVAGRTPAKALFDLIAQEKLLPPISDAVEEVPIAS
jgi:hypothetical protein